MYIEKQVGTCHMDYSKAGISPACDKLKNEGVPLDFHPLDPYIHRYPSHLWILNSELNIVVRSMINMSLNGQYLLR